MKRALKVLALVATMTVLFAVPVMAEEVTDPKTVLKEDGMINFLDNHAKKVDGQVHWVVDSMADKAAAQRHHDTVMTQVARYENVASDNYIKYLDAVIYNLNNTVRIKKEIVNNYKWVSQSNPAFAAKIPEAEADLAQAQAWVDFYTAYKAACKQDLNTRYPR